MTVVPKYTFVLDLNTYCLPEDLCTFKAKESLL